MVSPKLRTYTTLNLSVLFLPIAHGQKYTIDKTLIGDFWRVGNKITNGFIDGKSAQKKSKLNNNTQEPSCLKKKKKKISSNKFATNK